MTGGHRPPLRGESKVQSAAAAIRQNTVAAVSDRRNHDDDRRSETAATAGGQRALNSTTARAGGRARPLGAPGIGNTPVIASSGAPGGRALPLGNGAPSDPRSSNPKSAIRNPKSDLTGKARRGEVRRENPEVRIQKSGVGGRKAESGREIEQGRREKDSELPAFPPSLLNPQSHVAAPKKLSPADVARVAGFRHDSKLRTILMGDEPAAGEMLAVTVHGSFGDLRAWLKAHGVTMDRGCLSIARERVRAAARELMERHGALAVAVELPVDVRELAAGFRHDSKLRPILLGDKRVAYELVDVADYGSWKEFVAWLKAHDITMSPKASSMARLRLRAATDRIRHRNAVLAAMRAEAKRCGTTIAAAAMDRAAAIIADIIDAAAGDPKDGAKLVLAAAGRIVGIRGMELREAEARGKKSDRALKRKEFELRRETKVKAGLKQIENEMGRNTKVKAAINDISKAMEEGA